MRQFNDLKIAVAGTGYVGLSIATLLAQKHTVTAVDVIPEKVEKINNRISPIQDDYIVEMLMTTSHHYLMFFTNMGRVYRIKAYEIPEASRTSRGTAIINLIPLQPDEKTKKILEKECQCYHICL